MRPDAAASFVRQIAAYPDALTSEDLPFSALLARVEKTGHVLALVETTASTLRHPDNALCAPVETCVASEIRTAAQFMNAVALSRSGPNLFVSHANHSGFRWGVRV